MILSHTPHHFTSLREFSSYIWTMSSTCLEHFPQLAEIRNSSSWRRFGWEKSETSIFFWHPKWRVFQLEHTPIYFPEVKLGTRIDWYVCRRDLGIKTRKRPNACLTVEMSESLPSGLLQFWLLFFLRQWLVGGLPVGGRYLLFSWQIQVLGI